MNLEQQTNLENKGSEQEIKPENQEQEFKWDAELFKKLVQTPEGKKEIQRAMDKNFSKGLETWKANNLQSLIDEAVNKEIENRFPTDEKEIEIRKLKKQLKDKEIHQAVASKLEKAEIPTTLANFFIGETVEETNSLVDEFISAFNKTVNKEITNRLKTIGGTPRMGGQQQPMLTKEDLLKMPYDERAYWYQNGYAHLFK